MATRATTICMKRERSDLKAPAYGDVARGIVDARSIFSFVTLLRLAAALGLGVLLAMASMSSSQPPITDRPIAARNPERFILNALLVPALDGDAVPLRWVDPRRAMRCGPNSRLHVNGKPLIAGTLVPNRPFELEWQTNGCHPFGASGPRVEGHVRLTVFREDWGFSAMVEPSDLRFVSSDNTTFLVQRGAASTPQRIDDDEPTEWASTCSDSSLPCL